MTFEGGQLLCSARLGAEAEIICSRDSGGAERVRRRAGPTRARVRGTRGERNVRLAVQDWDWGRGFDPGCIFRPWVWPTSCVQGQAGAS